MKHQQPHAVVYIITKLELGGAQKVCLSLFNQTGNSTFATYLITDAQGILVDQVRNLPNVFLCNNLASSNPLHNLQSVYHIYCILKKIQLTHRTTTVHTHSSIAGVVGRCAAFAAGIKKRVHTIHGYPFHQHQSWPVWLCYYFVELLTSFITSHFICVSSYDVQQGIKLFPRFARKYSIIRAAVATEKFVPATTYQSRPLIIFGTVACFKPQKNLFDLLQAFEQVHQKLPHTRLELVGDGSLRTALQAWIDHHKLTQVITLHGWQHDVASFMRRWHAFVLSSLWEGLPCAVIEARSMQLPVISYDTGGIHDVIHHEVNGLLCAQKNWHTLANHMERIANNSDLHKKLATHSDNLKDFDDAYMIAQHHQLYTSLY